MDTYLLTMFANVQRGWGQSVLLWELHTKKEIVVSISRQIPTIDRGIRNTCQISFEFLFIKTRPPDKLHNGFGFVIQFSVGICYVICQGGEF